MWTRTHRPGASRALVAVALLALTAAACTGGAGLVPDPTIPAEPSMDNGPWEDPEGVVPPVLLQAAKDDAAARAGVDPGTVTVLSEAAVTFPNGALGCPEPGMMYTEVLTPGYQVVVEAGDKAYDYRASTRGGSLQWCENPPPAS